MMKKPNSLFILSKNKVAKPMLFFRHHPHPRLYLAIFLGICVALLMPSHFRLISKILIGWNTAVWTYLVLMAWLMLRANHEKVIKIANQEDKRGLVILVMLSIAAVASLATIVLELSAAKHSVDFRSLHYIFTATTVFGSWCFVGTMFTFHYARMYYQAATNQRPLNFPNKEVAPDYWDFLYFSFTISVAAQTSDVIVTSRPMRKIVLFQSVLSFFFNAAIIGLSINIAASLIS